MLFLMRHLDIDGVPFFFQNCGAESIIWFHGTVGHTSIFGIREDHFGLERIPFKHDDLHIQKPAHAWMPGNKFVHAFWNVW